MLHESGRLARELNRLDIKNRRPLPAVLETQLLEDAERLLHLVNGIVVLDQVSEEDCGVVTRRLRQRLAELGADRPALPILADSRERIRHFRNVMLKPNRRECLEALELTASDTGATTRAIADLAQRACRTVFCTAGDEGILLAEPGRKDLERVPAYPVSGPIDIVGAGDSTSAGIISALAAGVTRAQAAAFGNLVASITIQQLGTTGTATPQQVRLRWREVAGKGTV
jgi:bifunctional ADP-heptose synthase (sugar kinase/adenylyltransferase)